MVKNRWNYKVSERSFDQLKDKQSMVQLGQAYEVSELVTRYVQGNPPELSINNHYTKNPDIDAPALRYPFGSDMVDLQEEIEIQKDYANSLLEKDKSNVRTRNAKRDDAIKRDDAKRETE